MTDENWQASSEAQKAVADMMIVEPTRMQLWHEHCDDVAGLWEPLSWESFKRVHGKHSRDKDWVKCIEDAAKISHKFHCKKHTQNQE
jgi:hypothetical protein